MRIGHGYDVHRFKDGNEITIGGVKIPHDKALLAHSDGDVLIHAIADALLGALGERDIGVLFPDNDAKYENIDSKLLLDAVRALMDSKGFEIEYIDSTIIAQAPKMMPYIPKMKEVLCKILDVKPEDLSIKAKTKEKLDAVGQKLAIEANAVVMLQKRMKKMY